MNVFTYQNEACRGKRRLGGARLLLLRSFQEGGEWPRSEAEGRVLLLLCLGARAGRRQREEATANGRDPGGEGGRALAPGGQQAVREVDQPRRQDEARHEDQPEARECEGVHTAAAPGPSTKYKPRGSVY